MKFPVNSIRWRLQIWHGAVLLLVLIAFGWTAYRLAWENQLKLIDQQLGRSIDRLMESLVTGFSKKEGFLPKMFLNPREALKEIELPESDGIYYVLWMNGTEVLRSRNCPAGIPPPDKPTGYGIRTRESFRELVVAGKQGPMIVAGRSIAGDLADLHRQARWMILAGGTIAAFGLLGGWWLAGHVIKPIARISATAAKIAGGNLAERINVPETQTELGQLASTLNATFDRLQAAYEQLEASFNRQREFTADASHELRTPLSVILAEADSALMRERSVPEYTESMESIRRSARRMRRLTDSLLALARLDTTLSSEARVDCQLNKLAQETIETLRPLAEQHGVKLSCQVSPVVLSANAEQLGLIVSNLVSNAIYYNRPGGTATLQLTMVDDCANLTVSDDGQGIAPDDLPHIFERFYRADKSRSGADGHAGLGLAITKAIVEAHSGTITVSSQPGTGATFTIRLPQIIP